MKLNILRGLLSTKTAAFATVCCTLLMLIALPAWGDQCTAPSVGSGIGTVTATSPTPHAVTGCGAVINVFTVDNFGNATAFSVVPISGTGNPYDGVEDTLVGVQNNSGLPLTSISLTSSTATPFGFDSDGPCNLIYHSPAYSWCPSTTGYEGPVNTFNFNISTPASGTINFTTPIPNGGSTWFALEGTPDSLSGTQTVTLQLNPTTTFFPFNTGAPTVQTIDYTNSGISTFPLTYMQVTFLPISDPQFQTLVGGTFAQGSQCMPQQIKTGTVSCAVTIALCSTSLSGPFSGAQCPQATSGFIGVIEKYSNAFPDPTVTPINNPGYLAATDNALSCPANDNNCKLLHNIFTKIQDDCCTTSGTTKTFNSLFVPVFNLSYVVTSVDEHNVVGFSQPVDNPGPNTSQPVVNAISSKQAIPLKLTVTSGVGAPVTNLDLVGSASAGTIKTVVLSSAGGLSVCGFGQIDSTPTTAAAGNSGWQNLGNGMYQYNWKPSQPVGSCLSFSIDLGDGIQHTAYFKVTK